MHDTKQRHVGAAVLSICALAGVLSALVWVDAAGANQHGHAEKDMAVLVISSNTHLVLEPMHTATFSRNEYRMACERLVELPFASIGMNCRRLSNYAVSKLAN